MPVAVSFRRGFVKRNVAVSVNGSAFARGFFCRDNHIRPQHHFLSADSDVFRFEDGLEHATRKAFLLLGADPPDAFPHSKRSSAVRPVISEQTASLIAEFYQEDFARFDYDLGDPSAGFDMA